MSKNDPPERIRKNWFIILVSLGDGPIDVILGWKYVDGSLGLYSSQPASKQERFPWGGVIECKFKRVKKGLNLEDHFAFENRGREKRYFWLKELNPPLWSLNSFTSMILELRAQKKRNSWHSTFR